MKQAYLLFLFVLVGCASKPDDYCELSQSQINELEENFRIYDNQSPNDNCASILTGYSGVHKNSCVMGWTYPVGKAGCTTAEQLLDGFGTVKFRKRDLKILKVSGF